MSKSRKADFSDLTNRIYDSVGDSDALAVTIAEIERLAGRSRGLRRVLDDGSDLWLPSPKASEAPGGTYHVSHRGEIIPLPMVIADPGRAMAVSDASSLLQHARRAMALTIRLERLQSQLASFHALVDALSTPVFLVDRTCVLQYSNSAGEEALRHGEYLVLRNGGLQPRGASDARHLRSMLQEALSEESGQSAFTMGLHDAAGGSALLRVHSLRGQMQHAGTPPADAAFFLTRARGKQEASASRIRSVFALTPAETRLAEHLLQGECLAAIGQSFNLSRETLKTQLRSLFTKTGTHRQAELIARLLSSVSLSVG